MSQPQKLPSGNFRIRVKGPDGSRHSVTADSIRKVQEEAKRKTAELWTAKPTTAKRQPRVKVTKTRFDLFAESWLHTRRPGEPYGYKPVVYRQRLNHLRTLNETFGHRYVQDISVADVREWWNSRSATPAHRSSLYWFLHAVLDVALDDELIPRNPCRVKGASRPVHKKRPTFTDEDVEKIMGATTDPQMRVILQMLTSTALRIGELLALDWEHIEFFDRRLHVVQHLTPMGILDGTKTGTYDTRSIALPPWVLELLLAWGAETEPEGPVFRNTRGTRLSIDTVERAFRTIRASVGLDAMHLHDCRHVALTSYAQLPGVTLADLMAYGGHKSARVAMQYQHSSDERAQMHAANAVAPRWVRQ